MNVQILSNSPTRVNSGFGIVCRGLANGLKELGHNVSVSDMQNIYNKQYWNGITIYPMNSVQNATTGNEFYISEFQQLVSNLKDSKADVMLIIYPTYDNVVSSNRLHEIHKNTVWYYPVDGLNISKTAFEELAKVKKVIPMTKNGREELLKGNIGNITKEIYHGYDEKTFYKIGGREGERNGSGSSCSKEEEYHYCKWCTDKYQLIQDPKVLCKRGCFDCRGNDVSCEGFEEEIITVNVCGEVYNGVVGNLELLKDQLGVDTIFEFTGENASTRKKIDRLLAAYSILCKSKDVNEKEVMLLMHTMPVSNNGLNLWDYIKKYDLMDKKILFVYGEEGLGNSWSDKALNVMYNSGDINISCSGAEGFGLPTLESMAVGKPQIGPRFSSFIELIGLIGENGNECVGERGLLAKIQGFETLPNGLKRALVSSENTAELMNIMMDDKELRKTLGNNACKWAKDYTWSHISKEFDKLLVDNKIPGEIVAS